MYFYFLNLTSSLASRSFFTRPMMQGSKTRRHSEDKNSCECTKSFTVIIFCFVSRFSGTICINSAKSLLNG